MKPIPARSVLSAAVLAAAAALAGACGAGEDTPAGAKRMSFELTDAGCVPNTAKAPAGPIVFEVKNAGTTSVAEFEVLEGETILGEKEDLSDGLSGSFTLTLEAGEYTLYCPGGSDERGTLTVSGKAKASPATANEQ
jgi:iron uptake system component EfeO